MRGSGEEKETLAAVFSLLWVFQESAIFTMRCNTALSREGS